MDNSTITIRQKLSYFILNNIHIILIITVCFYFRGIYDMYVTLFLGLLVVLSLVKIVLNYLQFLSISYTITDQQIISKKGFFNKKTDFLEMYRIYDYQMNQSFLQKFFYLMNVDLISRDITSPVLKLHGIGYNSELVNLIRERVENSKRIKNVLEVNQFY